MSSLKRQILSTELRRKHNFHTKFTLDGVVVDFCCYNGSPDRRDVKVGLTDQIIYHRQVGGFPGARPNMCGVY
jgi:hypothetical protein